MMNRRGGNIKGMVEQMKERAEKLKIPDRMFRDAGIRLTSGKVIRDKFKKEKMKSGLTKDERIVSA